MDSMSFHLGLDNHHSTFDARANADTNANAEPASNANHSQAEAPPPPKPTGAAAIGLERGLPPGVILKRLRRAGRHSELSHRVLAFHLAEVAECNHHHTWGYSSVEAFAERELGLSRRTTRDFIRAGKKLETLPEIDEAFSKGKINWSVVRELVKVAVPEQESKWIETAATVTQRKLEQMVATHREGDAPNKRKKGIPNNNIRVVLRLAAIENTMLANLRSAVAGALGTDHVSDTEFVQVLFERFKNAAPSGNAPIPNPVTITACPNCHETHVVTDQGHEPVHPRAAFFARINSEPVGFDDEKSSEANDVPPPAGSPEDTDPPTSPRLRNFILKRDGHTCITCRASATLQVHHIVWRSQGGKTVPTNLVVVCARCHALIHDRFLSISGDAPSKLKITRTCPSAEPLEPMSTSWLNDISSRDSENVPLRSQSSESMDGQIPSSSRTTSEDKELSLRSVNAAMDSNLSQPMESEASHANPISESSEPVADIKQSGGASEEPRAHSEARLGLAKNSERKPAPSVPRIANPSAFDHVVGVARNVASLRRAADSAIKRGCAMSHTLLAGPAGLGKSTLARATAAYLNTRCHEVNVASFETVRELVDALRTVLPFEVLFLDEIQELKPRLMTALLSAMQDGKVTIPPLEQGGIPEHVRINPITIIGATTDPDRLSEPLRSRFGSIEEMTRYKNAEIVEVIKFEAKKQSFKIAQAVAERIAFHSDGIPRTALAFFVKTRDVAMGSDAVDLQMDHLSVAEREAGIDSAGLRPQERELVAALTTYGCLARSKVASLIGMGPVAVRDLLEPALIRKGVLTITPRGLRLTPKFGPNWAKFSPSRAAPETALA